MLGLAIVGILGEGAILSGRDLPPLPGQVPVILGKGGVTAHKMSTKSWQLFYDRAQTSPDGSLAQIDNIHDGVFFRDGKPYVTISAKHVSVNTLSDDFTATGDVHVTQLKARVTRTFDTDLIVWANSSKQLTLSHPSLITTGGAKMSVQSATFNVQTGEIHLGKIGGHLNF
ncbi:MAG: LPS export ABC transporter periplasmic protein LptC [Candidatus Baltobacteraceae bacterium]